MENIIISVAHDEIIEDLVEDIKIYGFNFKAFGYTKRIGKRTEFVDYLLAEDIQNGAEDEELKKYVRVEMTLGELLKRFQKQYNLMEGVIVDDQEDETLDDDYLAKYILTKCDYLKMKSICELAGVNYQRFRDWKRSNRAYKLTSSELTQLYSTIKTIADDIGLDDLL